MKFAVTYHYYPLGRFQHEQPGKALLQALNAIKLQAEAEKNDVLEQLQAALAENTRLNNQLTELQNSRAAYEDSLENLYESSSSWRLTAPLRVLCTGCSRPLIRFAEELSTCTAVTAPCSVSS